QRGPDLGASLLDAARHDEPIGHRQPRTQQHAERRSLPARACPGRLRERRQHHTTNQRSIDNISLIVAGWVAWNASTTSNDPALPTMSRPSVNATPKACF